MATKMAPDKLVQLREFIRVCRAHPEILHTPELGFFKQYVER